MLLKEIAEIYFSLPNKVLSCTENSWVTVASLLENNMIISVKEKINFDAASSVKISQNNIVIKRIAPSYINVYNSTREVFAGPNLIVIKTNKNANYIAYCLSQRLNDINNMANSGARFSAINRALIENIEIPDLSEQTQNAIGNIWVMNNKKQKLMEDLAKKEKLKKELIEKNIFKQIGEIKNGRN